MTAWRIEPRTTHTARSGRERTTFYVVRGSGPDAQYLLAGFTDEPERFHRRSDAEEVIVQISKQPNG